MTRGGFEFIRRSHSQMERARTQFRHHRRGKYCFFSYGNCEINSPLEWGVGDLNDYERYLYQLLE